MPQVKVFDREEIKGLFDKGYSQKEISEMKKCSLSTVRRIIETGGATKVAHQGDCKERMDRYPILPEEISRYRERIRIGQLIRLTFPVEDEGHIRKKVQKCKVLEKYEHIFLVLTPKNHKTCFRYVDVIVEERGT